MPETIEGEAVEVDEPRALAVISDQGMSATGPLALAGLTDDEFDRRLAALDTMRTRVARMQKALMVLDVDYGVIPGTGTKPTLLKPGAEKLCQAYGLAADFLPKRTTGDGLTVPHLSYVTRCELHLGSLDGLTIAVGYGAANSWERKHRYRRDERVCPACGQKTIIKGKVEYGGGWVCFKKKGGCGAKWPDGAAEIESQSVGDIENPDPFDLDVVLAKMSEKRAFIDATLRATAASGLFTQDIEDHQRPLGEYETPPDRPELERTTHESGLLGIAELGKAKGKDRDGNPKAPPNDTQYELRQEATHGSVIGFRLTQGRKGYKVLAFGQLAADLSERNIIGERVTCWGTMHDESFVNDEGKTITYQAMHLERIETPDGPLPAPDGAPTVPTEADTLPFGVKGGITDVPETPGRRNALAQEPPAALFDTDLSDMPGEWVANEASDAGSRR